jgi:hypothetical protein
MSMWSNDVLMRQRTQDAWDGLQRQLMRERTQRERQVDEQRRHERRVVAVAQAIRTAVAENDGLFSGDADVPAMAEAAVGAYEKIHGR